MTMRSSSEASLLQAKRSALLAHQRHVPKTFHASVSSSSFTTSEADTLRAADQPLRDENNGAGAGEGLDVEMALPNGAVRPTSPVWLTPTGCL
jgi:hypothetical protein